jgi:hypothetical protein
VAVAVWQDQRVVSSFQGDEGFYCIQKATLEALEAEAGRGFYGTEKKDLVAEEAVVPMPALQVVDGRGAGVFVGAMDDFQAEEPWPSGLEERAGGFAKPDLVFVAVVGRGLAQLCRRGMPSQPCSRANASEMWCSSRKWV